MKKRVYRILNACLLSGVLFAGIVETQCVTVRAEKNANVNESITTGSSNGQNGTHITGSSDKETNTNSENSQSSSSGSLNSYQESKAHRDARTAKESIRDMLLDFISQIKKGDTYISAGASSSSSEQYAVGILQVPSSQIQSLLNKVQSFESSISKENGLAQEMNLFDEVSNNEHPNLNLPETTGDWNQLSASEKTKIKKVIIQKEGLPNDCGNRQFALTGYRPKYSSSSNSSNSQNGQGNKKLINLGFNPSKTPNFFVNIGNSLVLNTGRNDYNGIRNDIIKGGFNDADTYSGRFPYLEEIVSGSNAMEDYCVLGYIKDCHISSVQKDKVEIIDYTSDVRRWNIIDMATGKSIKTVKTNNLEHTLTTSFNRPGKYKIVAEQEAKYRKGTSVTYEICDYLFDVETKNLLYFNDTTLTKKDDGGSFMFGGKVETGWVPTGYSEIYNINDLGQVEKDGSSVERTE